METLLSVADAQAAITAALPRIAGCETLPLADALGRVLATDLLAPLDVPAHDNAAMDGWALRSADVAAGAARLTEVGTSLAGHPWTGRIGPGQCVRIMTGAVVPAGADVVVMQEAVQVKNGSVEVCSELPAGHNVRRAGEDIARGAIALRAGTMLRPAHLGVAASVGQATLAVTRRPRVAVFSTGDELRDAGQALTPGAIHDSNRHVLLAMLARLGCETRDLGVVADEPARLEAALLDAAGWGDAIITSGGVSTGERDYTRALLARLGEVRFCSVAMRPGRPMAFGRLHPAGRAQPCMLFALPGNPVAAMVSFTQFARGALLRMQGCEHAEPLVLQARARHAIAKKPGRTECQRGNIVRDGQGVHVQLTGQQGSGMLSSMGRADCLVLLHHDQGDIPAGAWVDILPFEGLM